MMTKQNIFTQLGLPSEPLILAPLAGVSDHPFRRMCSQNGADLTYVEMLSATALIYRNKQTLNMLKRHPDEPKLGVQLTARTPEEMYEAVRILDEYPFDTVDINMGCPVKKVVSSGCGSAILKDPQRVFDTTAAAIKASSKPVSVKIRLGWDHTSLNYVEVGKAAQEAGAQWLTIHGRTRSDTYAQGVDLDRIGELVKALDIPVIGNGNLFCYQDCEFMKKISGVQGFMISRGALGNPWIFKDIKEKGMFKLPLDAWLQGVKTHIAWQIETYGETSKAIISMRKHLLWLLKGWPGSRPVREVMALVENPQEVVEKFSEFAELLRANQALERGGFFSQPDEINKFLWDPKFEMDREHDRSCDF
jgi:tRNA-dihydrouridine synthase B